MTNCAADRATAWTGRGALPRPAVDRAVDGSAPFVALVGPAGFGKTVALNAIAQRHDGLAVVSARVGRAALGEALQGGIDRGLVLLDDAHLLEPERSCDLVRLVERVVAQGGRLVLASRTTPPLPLRRWQVEGTAEVVSASGLAFDHATLSGLFEVDVVEIDRIMGATHGWPSAVALLAQRMNEMPFEAALRVMHPQHVSYVAEEVLGVLDDDERDLLRTLAVLDHLDGEVVGRVLGDRRGLKVLWDIADRTQLFESVSPGQLGWRGDVRAALMHELLIERPESVCGLHLAAAEALGMQRRHVAARLGHLIQAGAWDLGLDLLVAHWREMLDPDQFDVLADAAAAMPPDTVASDPVLQLGTGAVLLVAGHTATAKLYFDEATAHGGPEVAATVAALLAHGTWWSTPPSHALDHLDEVARFFDGEAHRELLSIPGFEAITAGRSILPVSRARALALVDDVGQANEQLRFLDSVTASDPVASSVSAWATRAWVAALAGELADAATACTMAFSLARDGGWLGNAGLAPAHLARALIVSRSGTSVDTWHDLASAAELALRVKAWGLLRTTRAVAAMCGHLGRPLLESEPEVVVPVPLADRIIAAWQAVGAQRSGDHRTAASLLAVTAPSEMALCQWVEASVAVHGVAHTAGLVSAIAPPQTPAAGVDRLLVDASLTTDPVLRAELIRDAAELGRSHGLYGLLRNYPGAVLDLIESTRDEGYLERVLTHDTAGVAVVPDVALSERELQILRFLDGPLSINEVGAQVYLSGHTVKWYISRIYRKLHVHSRSEAVERARTLGLFDTAR